MAFLALVNICIDKEFYLWFVFFISFIDVSRRNGPEKILIRSVLKFL